MLAVKRTPTPSQAAEQIKLFKWSCLVPSSEYTYIYFFNVKDVNKQKELALIHNF